MHSSVTVPALGVSGLLVAADPGVQGTAAGSVQETIVRVLGRTPGLSLMAFAILWRASIGRRDDFGLFSAGLLYAHYRAARKSRPAEAAHS
jgi:hypothetical protein